MNDRPAGRGEWALTAPSLGWLLVFMAVPALLVFALAFKTTDAYGNLGAAWTLDPLRALAHPLYRTLAWRTLWISLVSTLFCLLVALPVAYCIARAPRRRRQGLLLLVVIPFWLNFVIRIYAWKVLLHPEGALKKVLVFLHLIQADTLLLYRPSAVILVIVYSYLPMAVLPLFAAAERFDFALLDAARDLGASRLTAFLRVFLPGIRRGLGAAALIVFIPALGSYLIPDIVGGASSEMVGNKIAQRVFVDRNLPLGCALSAALTLAVMVPLMVALALPRRAPKAKRGPAQ